MSLQILAQAGVPSYLAQIVSEDEINALNKAAAEGCGGTSIPHISIKGSRFRTIIDGEQTAISDTIQAIVVLANPRISKVWYAKQWQEGDKEAPDCWSDDGVSPDPASRLVQARTCAECPQNAWGSKKNPSTGKDGKACADIKRLAIVAPKDPNNMIFQLALPPASLKEWADYSKTLTASKAPYTAVLTKMTFDTNVSYPRILFEPVRWLTMEEFTRISELHKSQEAKDIAGVVPEPKPLALPGEPPMRAIAEARVQQTVQEQVAQPVAREPAPQAQVREKVATNTFAEPATDAIGQQVEQELKSAIQAVQNTVQQQTTVDAGGDLDALFAAGWDDPVA